MIIPPKLQPGDEIRIVAPSRSLTLLSDDLVKIAIAKLEAQGFKVTFSKNCKESDMFMSSSIKSRVNDLHEAFRDKNVKAILTVIGGFNVNQILKYLDYELIKNNPKIICGYSDITALTNAITAKTGLITYYGPHFSNWGMKKEFDYTLEYFKKCLTSEEEFVIEQSPTWSDDAWYRDQENRNLLPNKGYLIINKGEAQGEIVGGNLCTLNLLQGTEFMPSLKNKILFVEGDDITKAPDFDRNLQSLIHLPDFKDVKAIVIGMFQKGSEMTEEKLRYIIATKKELANIPVIANVNFGHANPIMTFPIGGTINLKVDDKVELRILEH